MNAKESVFYEYINREITEHEELLERAYLNSDMKHINNNRLIIEKLSRIKFEFEKNITN